MATAEGEKRKNGPSNSSCCPCGYPTPLAAMREGPREKILYVTCVRPKKGMLLKTGKADKPDFLATVDVDPESPTYRQVIHRTEMAYVGDELHHFGWNACSSCYGCEGVRRTSLFVLSLLSSNIYVVNVSENPRAPRLVKVIEHKEIAEKANSLNPHTTHCLPSKQVMVSTLGDTNGNAKGSFLLLDSESYEVLGTWQTEEWSTPFGYGFWYQPYHNVMISSEWGAPRAFEAGYNPLHVKEGLYGRSLHIWDWKEHVVTQTIDMGPDGMLPFEVRFLHNPKEAQGYVGCSLSSTIFRFFKTETGEWDVERVLKVDPIPVRNWMWPEIPGLLTDNLISLDDKYLYMTLYLHGDVRQYDISDRSNPKLVGRIILGGCYHKGTDVYPVDDTPRPDEVTVQGTKILGGPHKIQLSLDGKRLYVTNSLFTIWDNQFYPDLVENGATCVMLDVDTEKGGLTLNENFLVKFSDEHGPALAHEIRYPGGDCTSDVWLARDNED